MEFTYLSLLGAFAMLVLGVIEYAVLQKLLYVLLRDRYETAKVTGSHGMDPATFWNAMRFFSFLVLPIVGFLYGDAVLGAFVK